MKLSLQILLIKEINSLDTNKRPNYLSTNRSANIHLVYRTLGKIKLV